MQQFKLLGLKIDSISQEEVYNYILKLSQAKDKPAYVVLLDVYLLMKAQFNKPLFKFIYNADLVLPISGGIKFGLGFLNRKIEKLYNYFNFTINLLLNFTDKKKFVYILGGRKNLIDKVDKNIRDSFPGIRLVGRYHAEYKKNFEDDLLTAIRKATPALTLIGMNRPYQEKWLAKNIKKFNSGVVIGVGDFVNIVGGKGKSPNDKLVESGLYNVFNFIRNPFKIFRLLYYFLFIILLLLSKISKKH